MAYQQQYVQYAGYGQPMYPAMVPRPMMSYGAPPMPPMGYAPSDYYAAQQQHQQQQHYDPSLQQQSEQQVEPRAQSQQQGSQESTNGITEQRVPTTNMAAPTSNKQKLPDSFDMQSMCSKFIKIRVDRCDV